MQELFQSTTQQACLLYKDIFAITQLITLLTNSQYHLFHLYFCKQWWNQILIFKILVQTFYTSSLSKLFHSSIYFCFHFIDHCEKAANYPDCTALPSSIKNGTLNYTADLKAQLSGIFTFQSSYNLIMLHTLIYGLTEALSKSSFQFQIPSATHSQLNSYFNTTHISVQQGQNPHFSRECFCVILFSGYG